MTAFQYTFNGICNGTTKAAKQCRQRIVYANGYCRQHGGDSTEYIQERSREMKAKAIARAARHFRKLRRLLKPCAMSFRDRKGIAGV